MPNNKLPDNTKIEDLAAARKAGQDSKIPGGIENLKQDIRGVNDPALKSILKRILKLISNEEA